MHWYIRQHCTDKNLSEKDQHHSRVLFPLSPERHQQLSKEQVCSTHQLQLISSLIYWKRPPITSEDTALLELPGYDCSL